MVSWWETEKLSSSFQSSSQYRPSSYERLCLGHSIYSFHSWKNCTVFGSTLAHTFFLFSKYCCITQSAMKKILVFLIYSRLKCSFTAYSHNGLRNIFGSNTVWNSSLTFVKKRFHINTYIRPNQYGSLRVSQSAKYFWSLELFCVRTLISCLSSA